MEIDYTIRVLSEDCEVMNEETVITDDENDAQIVFLETVENMEDVYRRTKQFGPITVQLFNTLSFEVIREVRIGG